MSKEPEQQNEGRAEEDLELKDDQAEGVTGGVEAVSDVSSTSNEIKKSIVQNIRG